MVFVCHQILRRDFHLRDDWIKKGSHGVCLSQILRSDFHLRDDWFRFSWCLFVPNIKACIALHLRDDWFKKGCYGVCQQILGRDFHLRDDWFNKGCHGICL